MGSLDRLRRYEREASGHPGASLEKFTLYPSHTGESLYPVRSRGPPVDSRDFFLSTDLIIRSLQRTAEPHSRLTSLQPSPCHGQGSNQTDVERAIVQRGSHHDVPPFWKL